MNNKHSKLSLQSLDGIIDEIIPPTHIILNKWFAKFIKSDKRRRGRMIKKRRRLNNDK